jgi:hypothetical protein
MASSDLVPDGAATEAQQRVQRQASPLVRDAMCVKLTLQRSLSAEPAAQSAHGVLMGKLLLVVRSLWLRERQLLEQMASLESRFVACELERVRGSRSVKRRERRVARETRELEAKKRSLETYMYILSAPQTSRKPQTVLEDSEEEGAEDDSGGY